MKTCLICCVIIYAPITFSTVSSTHIQSLNPRSNLSFDVTYLENDNLNNKWAATI